MSRDTLIEQLKEFRSSNPIFMPNPYVIQYLNTIADILLSREKMSSVKIINGKKTKIQER